MAINTPDDINDLMGLFESDAGITTQNNIGVGGTPSDVNLWGNQKLLAPPQNLIQSTDTTMPAFRATATPNLSPAVSFDGLDDLLKTLTGNFFFLASHTVAMVVKFPPTLPLVNPVTLAHMTGFGFGGEVLRIMPSGDLEIQNELGTSIPVTVPLNSGWQLDTWAVVLWTVDATGAPNDFFDLRIDQIPVDSGFSSVIDSPNGFSVASFEDGTESADIEVASMVMYKRKLSSIEISDLENFLIAKYFTAIVPPPPPPPSPPPTLVPQSGVGLKRKRARFSDLDLDFIANPITGVVPRKLDEEAVSRSIRNLVSLNKYEKPFHPEIHSGLRGLLFEQVAPATAVILQRRMIELIVRFERRAELLGVAVTDRHEENRYDVTVEFRVLNQEQPTILTFSLTRLR